MEVNAGFQVSVMTLTSTGTEANRINQTIQIPNEILGKIASEGTETEPVPHLC